MPALREHLLYRLVAHAAEFCALGGIVGNLDERVDVGARHLDNAERLCRICKVAVVRLLRRGRERWLAGVRAGVLVEPKRPFGLRAPLPVDRAAREARTVEVNLDGKRLRVGEAERGKQGEGGNRHSGNASPFSAASTLSACTVSRTS